MNTFFKVAAGIVGGLAIMMSLGGFSKNSEKNDEVRNNEGISDDIFDGNNIPQTNEHQGEKLRRDAESGMRTLQEGFTKASNILGHLGIIFNSIIKMFYDDPCVKVTPTTYIV